MYVKVIVSFSVISIALNVAVLLPAVTVAVPLVVFDMFFVPLNETSKSSVAALALPVIDNETLLTIA